jgi:hypothetical protein
MDDTACSRGRGVAWLSPLRRLWDGGLVGYGFSQGLLDLLGN